MKNIFMGLLVLVFVFAVIGCSQEEVVIESQPLTGEQFDSQDSFLCTFDDIDYIIKNKVAYHLDDQERAHIDIPHGSYLQKEDKTGWIFKKNMNQDVSFYLNHISPAILSGKTQWDTPVVCSSIEQIPENFVKFLVTHPFVSQKYVDGAPAE